MDTASSKASSVTASALSALSSDDSDDERSLPDGELLTLVESLEEETAIPADVDPKVEFYGHPLSVIEAEQAMAHTSQPIPLGEPDEGQLWRALVVPNQFLDEKGQLRKGLNPKDFDTTDGGSIKPRRANLPLTQSDLLSSLTAIPSHDGRGDRYIFNGMLNGWPALPTLELVAIEVKRDTLPTPTDVLRGRLAWSPVWKAARRRESQKHNPTRPPTFPDPLRLYRATLRAPPWTARGWAPNSPGYCFWFEAQHAVQPRVCYGTQLLTTLDDDDNAVCTAVHMLSHRYGGRRHETPRDRLTYHTVCLLEWQHGRYTTVVESAFLNGMGGYKGKSE